MMTVVWKFASGQDTWSRREQPESKAIRPAAPDPQPPSRPTNEPSHRKCARTVPSLDRACPLWSGRLNAIFAHRVLAPVPAASPRPGNAGVQGDLLYRNPAGQLVPRPLLTPQEAGQKREMTSIEWAVNHVLRPKYPKIHHEIIIAALEYKGDIAPGADPDFPNSVLATVPPDTTPATGDHQEPRP